MKTQVTKKAAAVPVVPTPKAKKLAAAPAPVAPEVRFSITELGIPNGKRNAKVTTTTAAAIAAKLEAKPAAKPVQVATVAAPAEAVSRRVTPGAAISEWRVVRSQRKTQAGWFLQGGFYSEINGHNAFTVGFEAHYADRAEAYSAFAARKQALAVA